MRILMLHNRYRIVGGEERAVANLVDLLTRRGHAVRLLERSSDDLGRIGAGRAMLAGGIGGDEVHAAVREFGAEIVHAHNVHPQFGWRALHAARQAGAATVLHVHNFRLFCAIGIAFRDQHPCFQCHGRNTLPGLVHRCRGSTTEAVVYAAALARQQPRLLDLTDRFVAVSRFTAARSIELGLPAARTVALPHFAPAAEVAAASAASGGRYALTSGRLVAEKGFDTAIDAARHAGVPLVIAGDGPDAARLRDRAAGADIRLTGRLSRAQLAELRRGAAFCLMPSRCDESLGYAALEALADGVPVIGSTRGGLPELLGSQIVVDPDDQARWNEHAARLWGDPAERGRLGDRALATARSLLSEDAYLARLLEIYGQARVNRRPATGD